MSILELLAVAFAVAAVPVSGVLAITDTVLTQVTRPRIDALCVEQPRRKALHQLRRQLEAREEALQPVLLVELMCDVVASGILAVVAYRAGAWPAVIGAFVVLMPLAYLAAVALPRNWALHNLERAIGVAGPVGSFVALLWPVRLLADLTLLVARRVFPPPPDDARPNGDDSFMAVAGSPIEGDRIAYRDHELLSSVMEFGRTLVREVMVPRPDMTVVSADLTLSEAVALVQTEGYSRYPMTGESVDDVVGMIYAKDLSRAAFEGDSSRPVSELARPARFVPEMKSVAALLREMQAERLHLAVVVDEYGGTAGLVTMEDIIEELVGEIDDEFDESERPAFEALGDGSVRVEARLSVGDVNDRLDLDLPNGDWDTVGGLVFDHFGAVPKVGAVARIGTHDIEVDRVVGRRIRSVVIRGPVSPGDALVSP